jgi:hypothetical protein
MFGVGCWYPFTEKFMENGGCEDPTILDKYQARFQINFVNYAQNKITLTCKTHNIDYKITCSTIKFPYQS